ncbi:ATP-grasp fold amidoligase family protein [Halopseudomonas xiamenensis]|uniref:ATP-grasp fold amidoligase family protein n=1 Tax=Halopseudomonas xiamenensis TaxID=157792 RepID=UPI002E2E6904|nr:ATP-grasp fold amidoligase family protein [Halopseudomonas xiamenensis]
MGSGNLISAAPTWPPLVRWGKYMEILRSYAEKTIEKARSSLISVSLGLLPEVVEYQLRYLKRHGRLCNFDNPERLTEKLHHRMRYPLPHFSRLADKVLAREYIRDTVGEKFNVPLYGAVEMITASQFEHLPNTFVMKTNNSSGSVRIVPDKSREDIAALVSLGNSWLRDDFSKCRGERHYKAIRPQVLFEQALLTDAGPPADYKIHVFNPAEGDSYLFVQVINGRFGRMTQNLYSADWQSLPFRLGGTLPQSTDTAITTAPANLAEMLDVASRLAQPFGYCRVDLYLFEGHVYVGEITFTPGAGAFKLYPAEWDRKLGALFRWPEIPMSGAAEVASERSGHFHNAVNELG